MSACRPSYSSLPIPCSRVLTGRWHVSPPHVFFRNNLFLLPLVVAASLLLLLLTWLVPKLYRYTRKHLFRPKYQPIFTDDDNEAEADDTPAPPPPPPPMPSGGLASDFKRHIRSLRDAGSVLFVLEVVRTLCLCALLGLSIWATIQAEPPTTEGSASVDADIDILKKHKKGKKHKGHHDQSTLDRYSSLELGEFGVCAFYVSADPSLVLYMI